MASTSFSTGTTITSVWLNDVNNLVWGVFNGATTPALARTALGVSQTGTDTTYLFRANNLSDVANAATARTNLGITTGTAPGNIPVLDGIGAIPTSEIKPAISSRSSNTILGTADNFTTIYSTGTFTQTLTAAATLGARWWVYYKNAGTGIITLDPNGAETIDGVATLNIYRGEGFFIFCDGTNFFTVGRGTGLVLIDQKTASASATLDFTQGFNTDFDQIYFDLTAVLPATDNVSLWARYSQDGGSSYAAGATDYTYNANLLQAGTNTPGSVTAAQIVIASSVGNTSSDGGANGQFIARNLSSTTQKKHSKSDICNFRTGTGLENYTSQGRFTLNNNLVNGVRFLFSSGNITSGTISMYGLRKS